MQFQSFLSSPDVSFWHEFARHKLEVVKLSEEAVEVHGFFSNDNSHNKMPARVTLQSSSFRSSQPPPFQFHAPGTLYLLNTIENFKAKDKKVLLKTVGEQIWNDIQSGRAVENPDLLNRFLILAYGDLKKYRFHYWFAFPALNFPEPLQATTMEPLFDVWNEAARKQLQDSYDELRGYTESATSRRDDFAFLILKNGESLQARPLRDWKECVDKAEEIMIGVADPSGVDGHAGWPLRNLAVLIASQMKPLLNQGAIRFVLLRQWRKEFDSSSFIVKMVLPAEKLGDSVPSVVGWERDGNQKLRPRFVDLSSTMDPQQLAASQTSLNLQLMKWRLMPSLDLDQISGTKCLLFGAGTLGCNVARSLMSWGVQQITFIDNGSVSFSNPVRQSLFNFENCLNGGEHKATAAAKALQLILPTMQAQGKVLTVPMPGHSVPDTLIPQVRETIEELDHLVEEADFVFQLTDSREARWLPTVLCAAKNKPCINAALGFDTFLVMRHGCSPLEEIQEGGKRLGCYFCNDITGPSDSLRNRTLDQQCTVTRPGVSLLASSMAVELLVLLLQHPLGTQAPADVNPDIGRSTSTPLGLVPHQIRGFLSHFQNVLAEGYAYERCTACSDVIVKAYQERGADLVLDVMKNPSLLEDMTGLTEILQDDSKECLSWDEDELEDF